ncbi:MAG: TonB family protein [Verrucomicrobiota bacterium]
MPLPLRGVAGLAAGCCICLLAPLRAQDITVGNPVWFSADPAPSEELKSGSLKPHVPDELKKLDEVGYVVLSRHVDETGKNLSTAVKATHLPLQRSVEEAYRLGWTLPSVKRDGKRVAARVWIPVIFNPKSAAAKGPDATPRLLMAAPALTLLKPAPDNEPQVVRMKLSLDAAGAITASEPAQKATPNLLKAVTEALKEWRFAPARKGGQPVPAEIVVPVLCHGMRRDISNSSPVRLRESVRPEYPVAMRRYGISGNVIFDYTVDETGQVKNPVVSESDNPAFDEPALAALLQWKYHPAMRNGQPVSSRVRQPVAFSYAEGAGAFRINEKADQSKLPPELRYDTPVKIRGVSLPIYPYALRRQAVRGVAKATMWVDTRGVVTGVKILEAVRPEFGQALAAALQGFKFDPAYRAGKPVPQMVTFEQNFSVYDLPDEAGSDLMTLELKSPDKIIAQTKLDAPLKVVSKREARFPLLVPEDVMQGEAVIECLVDKGGWVRLARVKSATHEAFGYAAVQAASGWLFEAPTVAGKAVVVREEIPFKFKRPAPATAKAATTKPAGKAEEK